VTRPASREKKRRDVDVNVERKLLGARSGEFELSWVSILYATDGTSTSAVPVCDSWKQRPSLRESKFQSVTCQRMTRVCMRALGE
jgi:hypothetical protein